MQMSICIAACLKWFWMFSVIRAVVPCHEIYRKTLSTPQSEHRKKKWSKNLWNEQSREDTTNNIYQSISKQQAEMINILIMKLLYLCPCNTKRLAEIMSQATNDNKKKIKNTKYTRRDHKKNPNKNYREKKTNGMLHLRKVYIYIWRGFEHCLDTAFIPFRSSLRHFTVASKKKKRRVKRRRHCFRSLEDELNILETLNKKRTDTQFWIIIMRNCNIPCAVYRDELIIINVA